MNTSQKLHNAARSYCIDRDAYWRAEYHALMDRGADRAGSEYTDKAYDMFPRYNILSAILTDIERLDSDALPELAEMAELLILSGHTAQSIFTEKSGSDIRSAAIADERQRFADVIAKWLSNSIPDISPLPYRRVLSDAEVQALWKRVEARWGTRGSYFYPLAESTDPSLIAFDATAFYRHLPPASLQNILRAQGTSRLFELREYGDNNYQLSVDAWDPYYGVWGEGFWFTDTLDWIMYASHEDSVTTGGILTDAVVAKWPEAKQHPWNI